MTCWSRGKKEKKVNFAKGTEKESEGDKKQREDSAEQGEKVT